MEEGLINIIQNFETLGNNFVVGKRNKIKIIPYHKDLLNVKSFKIPGIFNGVIYRFFRKSKAQRSFEYANLLTSKDIGTPKPIAYHENKSRFRLLESYYICEHLQPDWVFKELFDKDIENLETILIQFAQFSFNLHENGIEFLDHSPGNTLVKKISASEYKFYLVDLNRMNFHNNMSFQTRMKNMARTTPSEAWVKIISAEYAKLYQKTPEYVFNTMWKYNLRFQNKVNFKRSLKSKFGIS